MDPDDPYLGWAAQWLAKPGAIGTLDVEPIASRLASISEFLPLDVDETEQARIGEFVPILEALLAHYPDHARLTCASACIIRKTGDLGRALELARRAVELEPSFHAFLCLARVEGDQEDLDAARTSYQSAAEQAGTESEKLQARSELGALLCAQGQIGEGLGLLDGVLAQDASHELARLATAFYLALRDGDDSRYDEVREYADQHPDSHVARDYLERFEAAWLHPTRPAAVDETLIASAEQALTELQEHDADCERFGASTHQYELEPPLSESILRELEQECETQLPIDYAAFLLRAGAWGAGPGYGLLPPDTPAQRTLLRGQFPHKRAVRQHHLRHSAQADACPAEPLNGVLALAHWGCDCISFLVVSGPRAGSIWLDLRAVGEGLVPTHNSFSEWYGEWIQTAAIGEWPELPIEPGACPIPRTIAAHLHAWEAERGLAAGSLSEDDSRHALSQIPVGGVANVAKGAYYFDDGEAIPPCPLCEHFLTHFREHRMLKPGQIRAGAQPRLARC
ncbi:hypothetical protein ACFL5O_06030, partial [Myxococcota bacterium]